MPVCDCVWRCYRGDDAKLSQQMCGQRGCRTSSLCRRVEVTGASPFGMSCISALVVSLQRWAARFAGGCTVHWSQTRRSDGVSAAAFCCGSIKTSGSIVARSSSLSGSRVRLVCLLVCLRPLASHFLRPPYGRYSQRARSKFVNIDAMASLFESLPPEMVQKCVEFLPFPEVHAEIKQVSKATRTVARRALTRGRWKPIRYVAEQGLAVCAAEDRAWPVEGLRGQQTYTDPPPAAACAIFREAWAIDPALVIRIICDWDAESLQSGYVWSDDWDDRAKAGVFLAEMGRIRAEVHQQLAVDLAQQQWVEEGGSPDDYLDFISGGDY